MLKCILWFIEHAMTIIETLDYALKYDETYHYWILFIWKTMFSNRNVWYHALFFCYIQLQLLFSLQPEVVRVIWTPIYHLPLLTLGLTAANLCSSRAVVVLVIQSGPCCCSSRYVCISFWFQKWAGEKMWYSKKVKTRS